MKYCALVVYPYYMILIRALQSENFPLGFMITQNRSFWSFGFESLADRRVVKSVSFLHSLLNNNVDSPELLSRINSNVLRVVIRDSRF